MGRLLLEELEEDERVRRNKRGRSGNRLNAM
jgi:hypothetical protein